MKINKKSPKIEEDYLFYSKSNNLIERVYEETF